MYKNLLLCPVNHTEKGIRAFLQLSGYSSIYKQIKNTQKQYLKK